MPGISLLETGQYLNSGVWSCCFLLLLLLLLETPMMKMVLWQYYFEYYVWSIPEPQDRVDSSLNQSAPTTDTNVLKITRRWLAGWLVDFDRRVAENAREEANIRRLLILHTMSSVASIQKRRDCPL